LAVEKKQLIKKCQQKRKKMLKLQNQPRTWPSSQPNRPQMPNFHKKPRINSK